VWICDYVAPLLHAVQLSGSAATQPLDRMLIIFHHKITE